MISLRELADASGAASETSGLSARFYEKDYWVTQVLRQISLSLPDEVVFKGGTSLSKGYGLIRRFSEDIDLLVLPRSDDPSEVEAVLDRIEAAALSGIPNASFDVRAEEFGLMRDVAVTPPYQTRRDGASKSIRLESGRRGGPMPTEGRSIQPLLGVAIPELNGPDFLPFEIATLHPARTLVEKLYAIHKLAQSLLEDPDAPVRSRQARHLYDVHELLDEASPALSFLQTSGYLKEIVEDCQNVNERWWGGAIVVTGSFADLAAFTDPTLRERIEPEYEKTRDELCHPGAPRPSWDEVVARVTANRAILTVD